MALVTVQTNPTRQLSSAAAASYRRMVTDGLPAGGINSAYRSTESQKVIFLSRYKHRSATASQPNGPFGDVRWYDSDGNGKKERFVRVRGLPVAVPGTSAHNTGLAIDVSVGTAQHNWLLKHGASHGWTRPLPNSDPVHFEYNSKYDRDARDQATARAQMKKAKKALRVSATSGVPDSATTKAAKAVESANDKPPTFPYGKKYAQTHSGAKADGIWGPKSQAANTKTVKSFQKAIGATADGDWGSATDAKWASVQKKAK